MFRSHDLKIFLQPKIYVGYQKMQNFRVDSSLDSLFDFTVWDQKNVLKKLQAKTLENTEISKLKNCLVFCQ
jgi:hypothetical protein